MQKNIMLAWLFGLALLIHPNIGKTAASKTKTKSQPAAYPPRCRESTSFAKRSDPDYNHGKCVKFESGYTIACCARDMDIDCKDARRRSESSNQGKEAEAVFLPDKRNDPCELRPRGFGQRMAGFFGDSGDSAEAESKTGPESRIFCDLGIIPNFHKEHGPCNAANEGKSEPLVQPNPNAMAEYADEYYDDDDDADEEGDYYEEMVEEIALEEELEVALADLMMERQSLLRRELEEALTRNIEAGMAILDKKHLQQRLLNG